MANVSALVAAQGNGSVLGAGDGQAAAGGKVGKCLLVLNGEVDVRNG